ncbi:MAG TPA: RDD family protein, partial [Verrucomicrobiae bacterium]|nr:RDD family protein [Verrucomicrobiae bacterium]
IMLVYTIPIVGLLTFLFISAWGFGTAVTAAMAGMRRERPSEPAAPPPPPYTSPGFQSPIAGAPMSGAGNPADSAAGAAFMAAPPVPPPALALPRAGFWMRMGAGFLDWVLIMVLSAIGGLPLVLLVGLAYFAGMWAWKGTTVGGIILRLQVTRTDGLPVGFLVAFVRALAAAFSAMVLFVGFFWIGWDREKQGWHDKLAGTVVVRLPYAPSLVCV